MKPSTPDKKPKPARQRAPVKKDALISIKGIYSTEEDDDPNVIEMFTTGKYYKRNGCYYICYDESEATGFEGSRTTLMVDERNALVTMARTGGNADSQLIVQRGVRHQCQYDLGFGDMMVGVLGNQVKSTLGATGGNLALRYSLDINSMFSSENEMYVHVSF